MFHLAPERVRGFVGPAVPVIIDDRTLNQRAIQMLGAILVQRDAKPMSDDAVMTHLAHTEAIALRAAVGGRPAVEDRGH